MLGYVIVAAVLAVAVCMVLVSLKLRSIGILWIRWRRLRQRVRGK